MACITVSFVLIFNNGPFYDDNITFKLILIKTIAARKKGAPGPETGSFA